VGDTCAGYFIGDVIRRETQTYEAVLKSIAAGNKTPQEIGEALGISSSYLSPYLKQLEDLHLVQRRIAATIPPERREKTKTSQYHLIDPYLRFYFRFIAPTGTSHRRIAPSEFLTLDEDLKATGKIL